MPPIDASDFYRWMWLCYDAGRADAAGQAPLAMEAGDAAIVAIVRADWRLRMGCAEPPAIRPAWLEALIEATPERIEESL